MSRTRVQQKTEQHMAGSSALTPLHDHGSLSHEPSTLQSGLWWRAGVFGTVVKCCVIAGTIEGDGDVEDTAVGSLCPPDSVLGCEV